MAAMTRRGLFGALVSATAAPKAAPVSQHDALRNTVNAVLDNKALVARMRAEWVINSIAAGLKTRAEVMRELGVS